MPIFDTAFFFRHPVLHSFQHNGYLTAAKHYSCFGPKTKVMLLITQLTDL